MRGRIFVVEDDLDVVEYYCLMLAAGQMELWGRASTGEEAVRLYFATEEPPDVVLLDHRIPGCTGIEVARTIRERDPLAVFVLVTADDSAIEVARALGIKRLKRKPVSHANLLRNLSDAIDEALQLRTSAT